MAEPESEVSVGMSGIDLLIASLFSDLCDPPRLAVALPAASEKIKLLNLGHSHFSDSAPYTVHSLGRF